MGGMDALVRFMCQSLMYRKAIVRIQARVKIRLDIQSGAHRSVVPRETGGQEGASCPGALAETVVQREVARSRQSKIQWVKLKT